jgi:hypothetical protein
LRVFINEFVRAVPVGLNNLDWISAVGGKLGLKIKFFDFLGKFYFVIKNPKKTHKKLINKMLLNEQKLSVNKHQLWKNLFRNKKKQ